MSQKIREWLSLILIALLPFHALLVTVLTKVIAGPDHPPMGVLALWKEAVLGLVLLIAMIELIRGMLNVESRMLRKVDSLDAIIFILIILGLVVSTFNIPHSTYTIALGIKYDFIPLLTFLILRRVPWSAWFMKAAMYIILIAGGIVSIYGFASLFLSPEFFRWLGYSDLHSLYVANGPLAPFQQIGGSALRRMQSTFSGPNQLGLWLLLPLSMAVMQLRSKSIRTAHAIGHIFFFTLAIFLSFSRAAWIAEIIILIVAFWKPVREKISRNQILSAGLVLVACVVALVFIFPQQLLRISSSRGHIQKPLAAIQMILAHPLGLGLGTAGPASNHTSDTCVELEAGADASWAKDHPNLCVFVDGTKVQPLDRECSCPFLPENWYLQIGVEMGVLGLVLYVALVMMVLRNLWKVTSNKKQELVTCNLYLTFLGISIAALFLHAWEDSAVAYSVWLLLSLVLF